FRICLEIILDPGYIPKPFHQSEIFQCPENPDFPGISVFRGLRNRCLIIPVQKIIANPYLTPYPAATCSGNNMFSCCDLIIVNRDLIVALVIAYDHRTWSMCHAVTRKMTGILIKTVDKLLKFIFIIPEILLINRSCREPVQKVIIATYR